MNETHPQKKVGLPLLIGIILCPIIFAWFTLRKGYSKKSRILSLGYLFGGLVLIGITPPPDETDSTYQTSVPKTPTLEEKVQKQAKRVFGKDIIRLEISRLDKPEGVAYWLVVEYLEIENLTIGLTRVGILTEAQEFIQRINENPEFSKIENYTVISQMKLFDQYGNENIQVVSEISLSKEIADKINWSNILYERFEKIAERDGRMWWHPALDKR